MAETGSFHVAHGRARDRRGCAWGAPGPIAFLGMIALLGAAALLLPAPRAAVAASSVTVHIGEDRIEPKLATVEPGGTVVWVNDATSTRSVVATDASFDSGPLEPGEQFQFAFPETRTATYEVPEVPGGAGTVVVAAATATPAAGGAPVAAPPTAPPAGFAYTGSATAVNALIGGTIMALGAGLLISARRFGLASAITGLPFAFVPDDLLPTRRHRRLLRERNRSTARRRELFRR
ncbi:MAG: cupredoxin domain-containing protein [Acidimicrobiia bacterium]